MLDTGRAERRLDPVRRQIKFERNLRDQIERLSQQLAESRQTLRLAPENIKMVVDVALQLAGQPPLQAAADPTLPPGAPPRLWRLPLLSGSWQRALDGMRHPYTQAVRPITFDNLVASGRDDVVLVHLNHPLVQLSLRLLRAEVWSTQGKRGLHRATTRIVPSYLLGTPAVIAHARLVIVGGDSQRLHEEIITAGGEIREGRFRRMNVGTDARAAGGSNGARGSRCTCSSSCWSCGRRCAPRCCSRWTCVRPSAPTACRRSWPSAAPRRSPTLRPFCRNWSAASLPNWMPRHMVQLEFKLWPQSERDQLQRNQAALRKRLEEIPDEIGEETKRVQARYADPQARLFPVAVTFVVPAGLE